MNAETPVNDNDQLANEAWVAENFQEIRYFEGRVVRWNDAYPPFKVIEMSYAGGEYMPVFVHNGVQVVDVEPAPVRGVVRATAAQYTDRLKLDVPVKVFVGEEALSAD